MTADTSIYKDDADIDSGHTVATFLPTGWNADGAKLGIVAVEAVHADSVPTIRIIELYGQPVSGPPATAQVH